MALKDDLQTEVATIFQSQWSLRDGRDVPMSENLKLANDGVKIEGCVLYADMDGSTAMVDTLPAPVAAEIYKAYLLCAARIIRSEEGQITAYDGDRIMAVYIGDTKNTRAVRSALKIKWAVSHIVNPALAKQYSSLNFTLQQVVGIDCSELLVARTGIRGSNDLVWVGPSANHAAKLSSLSEQPYSTIISSAVFNKMNQNVKSASDGRQMWEQRSWKGMTVYRSSWYWRF